MQVTFGPGQPAPPPVGAEVLGEVRLREHGFANFGGSLSDLWYEGVAQSRPVIGVVTCRISAPVALSLQRSGRSSDDEVYAPGYGGSAWVAEGIRAAVVDTLEQWREDAPEGPPPVSFGVFAGVDPELIMVLIRAGNLAAATQAADVIHRAAVPRKLAGRLSWLSGAVGGAPPEAIFEVSSTLLGLEARTHAALAATTGLVPIWELVRANGAPAAGPVLGLMCGKEDQPLGAAIELTTALRARNGATQEALADFDAMVTRDEQVTRGDAPHPAPTGAPRRRGVPLGAACAQATVEVVAGTTRTLARLLAHRVSAVRPRSGPRGGAAAAPQLYTTLIVQSDALDANPALQFPTATAHAQLDAMLDEALAPLERHFEGVLQGTGPQAPRAQRALEAIRALRHEPAEFTILAPVLEELARLLGPANSEARAGVRDRRPEAREELLDSVLVELLRQHPPRPRDPVEAWQAHVRGEDPTLRESIERLCSAVRLWSARFTPVADADAAADRDGVEGLTGRSGGPVAIILAGARRTAHGRGLSNQLLLLTAPAGPVALPDLFLAPALAEARLHLLCWPTLATRELPPWCEAVEELALTTFTTLRANEDLATSLDRIGAGFTARARRASGAGSLGLLGDVLRRTVALLIGLRVFVEEAESAGVADPRAAACGLAVRLIGGERTTSTAQPSGAEQRGSALALLLCEVAADLPAAGADALRAAAKERVGRFMELLNAVRFGLTLPGCMAELRCTTLPASLAGADARLNQLRVVLGATGQAWATNLLELVTELGPPREEPGRARSEAEDQAEREREALLSAFMEQLFMVVGALFDERAPRGADLDPAARLPEADNVLRELAKRLASPDADGDEAAEALTARVLGLGFDGGVSALVRLIDKGRAPAGP